MKSTEKTIHLFFLSAQSYGTPKSQSYGTPKSQSYGTPKSQSYGTPKSQSYGMHEDLEAATTWVESKVAAGQCIEKGHVGVTVVHQWRFDSASLWHLVMKPQLKITKD